MVQLHRRDETITPPWYRLDVERVLRILAQRGAQFFDRRVDAVLKIDAGPIRPEFLANLFSRHKFACPLEQEGKDLEGLFLEHDLTAIGFQFADLEIDLKAAETSTLTFLGGRLHSRATGVNSLGSCIALLVLKINTEFSAMTICPATRRITFSSPLVHSWCIDLCASPGECGRKETRVGRCRGLCPHFGWATGQVPRLLAQPKED